ncbi:hypothetical protein XGA_0725 [Xanthomonas hortorum ATCC 19865]|nr:hypothetical protein XGA_0725 [Xanthomonas hortorum ATCC 19865]
MQLSFGDLEYNGKRKRTRREVFLSEMDQGGVKGAASTDQAALSDVKPAGPSAAPAGSSASHPLFAAMVSTEQPRCGRSFV